MSKKDPRLEDRLLDSITNDSVPSQVGVNKVVIVSVFAVFTCAVIFGFWNGSRTRTRKAAEEQAERENNFNIPAFLAINDNTYKPDEPEQEEPENKNPLANPSFSKDKETEHYVSYEKEDPIESPNLTNASAGITAPLQNRRNQQVRTQQANAAPLQPAVYHTVSPLPDLSEKELRSSMYASYNAPPESINSGLNEAQYILDKDSDPLQTAAQRQNMQEGKRNFLAMQQVSYSDYLENSYTTAIAPGREVKAGSIIPITLITGINSDLPGDIIGQIISHVSDTATGQNILIPAGSKVYGKYDSSIAFGQDRVLVAWNRIVRPDGVSINIEGMQGSDLTGKSGIPGEYSAHFDDIAKALAASTAFDVGTSAFTAWLSSLDGLNVLSESVEKTAGRSEQVASLIYEKVINQQPTINVEAGTRANITVSKDMILPVYKTWGAY